MTTTDDVRPSGDAAVRALADVESQALFDATRALVALTTDGGA